MELLNRDNLKQIGLISLIVVLGLNILGQFSAFIPGALGAATLYILLRQYYLHLTLHKKWKPWVAATVFLIGSMIVFVMPVFFLIQAIAPKLNMLMEQTGQIKEMLAKLSGSLASAGIPIKLDTQQIGKLLEKVSSSAPAALGATANMLTNTVLAFFFLYFMLVQGKQMEGAIKQFLPLKETNVDDIWQSTKTMVYANAIGIPVLAICQGIVAIIGYWIFGVESYIFLGILTGVFSIVPLVGCALIWAPVCIYLGASGQGGAAAGLALYSFVVTGGIDNVLRFTLLKKLGDVHPVITTIGIIIGVPMFGFMGFIFGPLLVSYLLLLIKIYRVEFSERKAILVDRAEVVAEGKIIITDRHDTGTERKDIIT